MRLAVVGAGVIGVTTAYELTRDGHEVTVFERCATPAEGASFANGGLLAPEWLAVHASFEWKRGLSSGTRHWWRRGLRQTESRQTTDPGAALLNIARYGAERLDEVCDRLQLSLDSHQGMMVVWSDPKDGAQADELHARLRATGSDCHRMQADQARALELALSPEASLDGALVMPDIWSVNCRQFTLMLKTRAQQDGCRFEFGNAVVEIQSRQKMRLMGTKNPQGLGDFDGVVLCAGAATETLLTTLGLQIPLETWQGQSLSAAVREPLDAPVAVVYDLRQRVSIARMGQRVRVCGPLTRVGRNDHPEPSFKHLYTALDNWFPGSIRHGQAGGVQEWSAQVTTAHDGLPVIGRTAIPGLWINTGHGIHGWVMACGGARLLADQMAGQPPAIAPEPYAAER